MMPISQRKSLSALIESRTHFFMAVTFRYNRKYAYNKKKAPGYFCLMAGAAAAAAWPIETVVASRRSISKKK